MGGLMHPIIILGAVAGAFFVGRRAGQKKTLVPKHLPLPIPRALPGDIAVPDVELPDVELPGIDLPGIDLARSDLARARNGVAWAKTGFDVQIYPAGADKLSIAPPPIPSGLSAARDCSVVAVGWRWWDRAGHIAKQLADDRALTVANLERALFPKQCRGLGAGAQGMYSLRAELLDRMKIEFGSIRNKRKRRKSWWR